MTDDYPRLKDLSKLSVVRVEVVPGKPDLRTPEQKATDQAAVDAWLEAGKGGYTVEQLGAAFDKVKNREHWKMDIDAIIDADEKNIMLYAIPWYSGGGDINFEDLPDGKVRVRATGYWTNGLDG